MLKRFIVFLFVGCLITHAQTGINKIEKISWMCGYWSGEQWGGIVEEVWAPAQGNSLIGMFRFVKEGKIVFSELCYIVEENDSLNMKLKHFDYGLHGWEEKDQTIDFAFEKLNENEIIFKGLTYKLLDDNTMRGTVLIKNKKTGEVKEEEFIYKRKAL